MAFGGQQDFLKRLQQLYGDVVMNVVHVYFEREVLDKTTFFLFLDKNKHELFHELIPKISCCECFKSNSIASVSKTGCLDAFQFDLLFDRSACAETNHEIKRGQKIQQYCVCNINPKTVEVADLDIILIRAVIKACCKRTLPGNPSWLKEIKDVRNYIDHIGNSCRISKSDFEEKWIRLETNTLNIALMTGKSFQLMTQKDIHRLKAEHDTIDKIQAVAENANDSLKEDILNALKNQPGVSQDEIGQISYQLNPTKCYVRWTLSTPSSWCVEDIKRKLKSVTELTNFTLEFVYAGSIIMDTSVSLDLVKDPEKFCIAFLEFLQNFVKTCEIDTTIVVIVDVAILTSLLPYRGTGKRSFGRCRTCKNRHMTSDADTWCKDCQELFCNTCSTFHCATTYSANHNILCLNDSMEHFPPKISQILICNEHDRDFLFFCETHQHISCIECVRSYHSNCDIVALTFAALNRTSSSALEKSIELNVQELIADIEQVLSDLAKFSSSIELQYSQIKTSIADECKGNETMNTTLKDLKSKYETCTYMIEKDVNTLKSIKLNISAVDIQLYQAKKYCSERQAFVFMHNKIKSVRKADETFRSYINNMKTVNLHCESSEQIHVQGYQNEIIDIVCQFKPYIFLSSRKYENIKQAEAQISEMKKKNIDTIRLSKEFVFHLEFNRQRDFEFNFACLNDKIFINNTAGGLTVYNIDGTFHKEIKLPVRPEFEYSRVVFDRVDDITVINKDLLAVMRRKDILCVNISCCECFKSNSIASVSKTGCLDEFQFDLLYDRSACAETNHEIKRGQKFQQYCVCNINPNRVEAADLDIILIRAVIKTCCKRTLPGNPSWLKEIKDVRNYIYHTGNSSRISKSDFEEKWSLLEKNTLNIAMMTGKSFQYMTQKEIQRLKAEHDTTDRTHTFAEKANDCLKKEILNALKNQPGVKQDAIVQISYQLDQILFKITDLEDQISTKRKADVTESDQKKEEPTKCYVRWTLSTPSSWCVEDIKRKLRSNEQLAFQVFLTCFSLGTEIREEFTFGSCRTCSNRNLTTEAEKWCKDCQELYCNTCSTYHTATTPLADHTILSLTDSMEYFPPNIPHNITCYEHDWKFNFFCKTHQQIICVECVRVVHTNCADIVPLSVVTLNTTSSSIFENLVSHVQELIADTEQVLSDLANLSLAINQQNTNIKSAIADRFKGISIGNELISTTLNDLKLKHEVCKTEIEKYVKLMMKTKQKISAIDIQLYQMKEYYSERQAFFFVHNVVKSITRADKTFRSSLSDIKTLTLYYKSGETVNIQGYELEKLEIVLHCKPYIFHSSNKDAKTKQAQVPISVVGLTDKVIIINNTATGLLIYNIMGSLEREIEISHKDHRNEWYDVKDITVVSKNCIAVMRKNDILSVNVEEGYVSCITNESNLYSCRRICYCEDLFYIIHWDPDCKITVMNLRGDIVKTIINYEITSHEIISFVVQNNKIFILSKVLRCLDLNGKLLWKEQIERDFQSEIQISVDNLGNCYIPSAISNTIKVISNDGHQNKLLLPVTDDLMYPRAIYFDKTNNRLIVMTLYGTCTVFNVTFKE
ncbi:unnamed protein product [Mytilus edulis]|uniref:B box-type domain-containing protein n=1 Tax=Mytilus edulis TaxID=6550 RepID=A0A8S3S1A1_MYTED|nr:unnamed protein product [Mytilus edulis]